MRPMTEVMDSLDHLFEDFDAITRYGMATYQNYDALHRLEHDSRAVASCIYSHMAAEADRRWMGRPRLVHKVINGLKVWLVDDYAVIRFKRMDEDGRTRNYPTKQAKQYDRGMPLPGLPLEADRLTVGYFPNPTETEVERVQVARRIGKLIDFCAAIIPPSERVVGQRGWIDVTAQGNF